MWKYMKKTDNTANQSTESVNALCALVFFDCIKMYAVNFEKIKNTADGIGIVLKRKVKSDCFAGRCTLLFTDSKNPPQDFSCGGGVQIYNLIL